MAHWKQKVTLYKALCRTTQACLFHFHVFNFFVLVGLLIQCGELNSAYFAKFSLLDYCISFKLELSLIN